MNPRLRRLKRQRFKGSNYRGLRYSEVMHIPHTVVSGPISRRVGATFLLLALSLSVIFCGGAAEPEDEAEAEQAETAPAPTDKYVIKGRIVQLHEEGKSAVIEHEEIVGWMGAMTMAFPIRDDADWQKLKVGSQIEGTVFVSDDGFYVGDIKVADASSH
jgi:Cu/Ag efflux protein CusF